MRFRLSLVASIAVAGLVVTSAGFGGGAVGPDRDGDGVPSKVDNCELPDRPQVSFNPSQLDVYPQRGDGVGDACQSGVLVLRNGSSYALLEYLPQPGQPPTAPRLGTATGRRCDPHTACTFDDGPEGRFSYWYAEGTDKGVVDEGDVWADWTVEFHYRFAGHGDDATAPTCTRDANGDGYNDCFDQYTYQPWYLDGMHDATTPPNAGLEESRTALGVETLTARDSLPCDQTPAEGDPPSEYVLSPATPVPMSPAGPLEPGTYPTELWPSEDRYFEHGVVAVYAGMADTAALTGVVIDAGAGGDPIPGATVSITRRDCDGCAPLTLTTTTDVDGTFAFAGLPPGVYALVVHAEGYEDVTTEDDPYDAQAGYVTRIELENATA
jgi:Carboxypeptidase regulatory-like domain